MKKKQHIKAIFWYMLSLIVGCSNDAITKYVGVAGIHPLQISFCRLLVGLCILASYRFIAGTALSTKHLQVHIMRGGCLSIASTLWSYGLCATPMATATAIGFTIPLFVLTLAPLLLQEKVSRRLWLAACIGFAGMLVIVFGPSQAQWSAWRLDISLCMLVLAALLFALLDIINKKYVAKEPMLTMLFYTTLAATLSTLPLAYHYWQSLNICQLGWLIILGIGGILIFYCLLKAYMHAPIVWLSPLRYAELLVASIMGYFIFGDIPTPIHLVGIIMIILASLFIR